MAKFYDSGCTPVRPRKSLIFEQSAASSAVAACRAVSLEGAALKQDPVCLPDNTVLKDNCCSQQQTAFPSSPSTPTQQLRQIVAYCFRPGRKRRFSLCVDQRFAGEGTQSRFQPIWCKPDTTEDRRNVVAFLVWERAFWPAEIHASAYSVVVEMGALPRPQDLVWIRVDPEYPLKSTAVSSTVAACGAVGQQGTAMKQEPVTNRRTLRVDCSQQPAGELRLARFLSPGDFREISGGRIGRHRHPCVLGVVIEERFYTAKPAVISMKDGAR